MKITLSQGDLAKIMTDKIGNNDDDQEKIDYHGSKSFLVLYGYKDKNEPIVASYDIITNKENETLISLTFDTSIGTFKAILPPFMDDEWTILEENDRIKFADVFKNVLINGIEIKENEEE